MNMRIRDKLFLGFGVYVFIAGLIGLVAFIELLTIRSRFDVVSKANDLVSSMLEVRRFEKNFLLYRDSQSSDSTKKHLSDLKKNIEEIQSDIIRESGPEVFNSLREGIGEYERLFDDVVMNVRQQEETLRQLKRDSNIIMQKLDPAQMRQLSAVLQAENNYITYKSGAAYDDLANTIKTMGYTQMKEYRKHVQDLASLYHTEAQLSERLRLTARRATELVEDISNKEESLILATISSSVVLGVVAFLVLTLLGFIVNGRIARSISDPITRLEKMTKRLASGDFSGSVHVSGSDEIASLSESFNQMETQLRDALHSLEDTITQLREKQMQLVEAEKLASVGILASGIAHEISNPLTSVLTFSTLMLEACPPDHPQHERLKLIVRETTRARTIVRQLLSFSKEIPIARIETSLNKPVRKAIDTFRAQEAFRDVELTVTLAEDIPDISIDPHQVEQVVSNMLINALHAITPPGAIEISTCRNGDFAEVVISDTGSGIPEENLKKIFDPFFTTKDTKKGTGLGLAVSYGIIKKHGGSIEVESQTGKGSTFTVRLPLNG